MWALSKINGKREIPVERSDLKMRLKKTIAMFVFVLLFGILGSTRQLRISHRR